MLLLYWNLKTAYREHFSLCFPRLPGNLTARNPDDITAARGKPAKRALEKAYLEIAGKLEESQAELKKTSRLLRKEIKHSEKIESELQFSKARLQSLTTFADHHIFVLDKEGRYLFSNQKAGLSVSGELLSYVGRHQWEFHAPEVAETYDAQIKSVLQTGKAVDFEHFALSNYPGGLVCALKKSSENPYSISCLSRSRTEGGDTPKRSCEPGNP